MANTIDFNVNTNAVTVLNQTATAADNTAQQFTNAKTELKELQKQMLSMDASSAEFQKAAARAGELKDQMADTADAIRTSTGPALESMNNTFSIMSGQIANLDFGGLGQSLTSLGGAVSKINIKSLKDELGGLVKGLANLAGAIISNPLLALGGAVALLVVNFDKINAALSGTAAKVEKLGEANVALEKQNQILDARINKEKILYGQSFRVLNLEKEKAKNNIQVAENELLIAQRTGDVNTIREKENKLIEMRNLLSGITAQGEADRIKLVEEAKNITIDGYKEEQDRQAAIAKFEDARQEQIAVIADKQRQLRSEIKIEELRTSDEIFKLNSKNNDLEFNSAYFNSQKILTTEKQKQLQAELNQLVEEEQILRNAKVAIGTNTTVNDLKKQELAIQKDLNKENKTAEQLQKEADDAEMARRKKLDDDMMAEDDRMASIRINDLIERQKKAGDTQLVTEMQIHANLTALRAEQSQKEIEDLRRAEDAKAQLRVDAMKTSLSIISDLAEAFAGDSERQQKKAFAIQKGVSIATATIDTYLAAQGAYRSQMAISTPDAPVRAAVAAGIAIAQGLARVAIISKQQFKGGGGAPSGGGSGGSMPSAGGTTAPSPANFAFLQNQPNQQPPLQAYVVGTQVSSNLEAQQLIQNQSRLGG